MDIKIGDVFNFKNHKLKVKEISHINGWEILFLSCRGNECCTKGLGIDIKIEKSQFIRDILEESKEGREIKEKEVYKTIYKSPNGDYDIIPGTCKSCDLKEDVCSLINCATTIGLTNCFKLKDKKIENIKEFYIKKNQYVGKQVISKIDNNQVFIIDYYNGISLQITGDRYFPDIDSLREYYYVEGIDF